MTDRSAFDQYALHHNLVDLDGQVLYCTVAKNACSTLKYNFLTTIYNRQKQNYDTDDVNRNIHKLVNPFRLSAHPNAILSRMDAFVITRDPYERLVSAFLDKFVHPRTLAPFAKSLLENGLYHGSLETLTFEDFFQCILVSEEVDLNEHWMPQHRHLLRDVNYQLIPVDQISSHWFLKVRYQQLDSNIRAHTLKYSTDSQPGSALCSPVSQLRNVRKDMGSYPSSEAFVTDEIKAQLCHLYQRDVELHGLAEKQSRATS